MITRRAFLCSAVALSGSAFFPSARGNHEITVLRYRIRDAGLPLQTQGYSGWTSWMPRAIGNGSCTRFILPGILDPNHLDGIGPLWLLLHLPITAVAPLTAHGSPGPFSLIGGKVRMRARLSSDFQANGCTLPLWLCRNVNASPLNPKRQTNWAMTGFDFLSSLSSSDYQVSECVVSSDPMHWTYPGVNSSWQGELHASRYTQQPFLETVGAVDATLHLPLVGSGRVDMPPRGHIDVDWVEIETSSVPTPPYDYSEAVSLIASDPLGALRTMGALARAGNQTAMLLYGTWLATGVVNSTPIVQDTVTAAEMLQPISAVDARAAYQYARLLVSGDGVPRDSVAARSLLAMHANSPTCCAMLANMKLFGIGGIVDEAGAFADFLWAAERSEFGLPQPAAMAEVGRCYLIGRGAAPNYVQAYVWLKRCLKFATGYIGDPDMEVVGLTLAAATANLPNPRAAAELDAGYVTNWTPTPV